MNTLPTLIILGLAMAAGASRAADAPDVSEPRDSIERQLRQAQEQLDRTAREVARLTMRLTSEMRHDSKAWGGLAEQHVMLGLTIGTPWSSGEAGRGERGPGVRVMSVSPGGPADVAGLRANDVIVRFNGTELRDADGSNSRKQLLGLIHDVKADTPVDLEYRRDGKLEKARITPKSMSAFFDENFEGFKAFGDGFDNMVFSMGAHGSSGFGSTEFLQLSPGLGRYFGTERGLLVVRAPKDERLKLVDGDVVLDIDGRVPSGASHALQILSSYRPGEVMKLHIMRQQKRLELPVEIPPDSARRWSVAPPLPPSPPSPPSPPAAVPPPDAIEG